MTRLINADALMDDIRKHSESYFADDFAHIWVDKQPTVEAQPVRYGKWINFEHGKDKYYCNKCQTIWESKQIKNMHYCPTCGARMREDDEECLEEA